MGDDVGKAALGRYATPTNTQLGSAQPYRISVRKPGAPRHVVSFLVTSFFTRVLRRRSGANSVAGRVAAKGRMPGVKKEVTRSSAGGVEACLWPEKEKNALKLQPALE